MMKQRININIDKDIHKKGVLLAKAEGKKLNKYISFSKFLETLITKQDERT